METQKTLISQSITEKGKKQKKKQKKQRLEESTFFTSDYTIKPQFKTVSYWQRNQKYRSIEQDRKLRDKSIHLWVPYL